MLVSPSAGLGGGIERYVSGVEAALEQCNIPHVRFDLRSADEPPPSLARKLTFARRVLAALRSSDRPTRLLLAHPGLLMLAVPARRIAACAGTTVHFHGIEAWQGRRTRGARIARGKDVRATTGSSFTSGALQHHLASTVVAPPLPPSWFDALVSARDANPGRSVQNETLQLLTVFRLADWLEKGLPTIIDAAQTLDRPVTLTVIGSGPVPQELRDVVDAWPWVNLETNLSDVELAAAYARADVYVAATRTRNGRSAYGEGFGLTLVEAQLAGTPVVAPAHGGSHDAFQAGVTGFAPADESVGSLSRCLRRMADDPDLLAEMSIAAFEWSRAAFDPQRSARLLVAAIL